MPQVGEYFQTFRKPEAQRGGQRRASLIVCERVKICDFMMVTRQSGQSGLPRSAR